MNSMEVQGLRIAQPLSSAKMEMTNSMAHPGRTNSMEEVAMTFSKVSPESMSYAAKLGKTFSMAAQETTNCLAEMATIPS